MKPIDLTSYARLGLTAEIARLQQALDALDGPPASAAPAAPDQPKRRTMTPAQRRAHSRRMKAMWAAKRKAT